MEHLKDFMIDQLRELYNAVMQLKTNLEKMAIETSNEDLRYKFELHAKHMTEQINKLKDVFALLGESPKERYSYIMEGIGKEIQSFIDQNPEPEIRDVGFIALAQKAEHYEIALYGTLREYAHELNHKEAEQLLSDILYEEKEEDKEFTDLARGGINQRAQDKESIPRRFASRGRFPSE